MAKQHSDAIIAFMSLYAASQESLYIAYSDKFKKLAHWMLDEEDLIVMKKHVGFHPDVCGKCGIIFGQAFGGRIRKACPICQGSHPFGQSLLRYWWPTMMETSFAGCHHEIIEGYLAEALLLYGEARERRQRNRTNSS